MKASLDYRNLIKIKSDQYARSSNELFKMVPIDSVSLDLKEYRILQNDHRISRQHEQNTHVYNDYKLVENKINNSITDNIVNVTIAYSAGQITKKVLRMNSSNVFRNIFANLVGMVVTTEVYNNANRIKKYVANVFRKKSSPKS